MDIFSLDILQTLRLILSPWRWFRHDPPNRGDEIFRYNVTGLEIVVVNRGGEMTKNSVQLKIGHDGIGTDGATESLSFSIEIERPLDYR